MDTKRDLKTKVYGSQKCSGCEITDPHRQENILASMVITSAYVYEEVMILVKYRKTKNQKQDSNWLVGHSI